MTEPVITITAPAKPGKGDPPFTVRVSSRLRLDQLPLEMWWETVAAPKKKGKPTPAAAALVAGREDDEYKISATITLPHDKWRRTQIVLEADGAYRAVVMSCVPIWQTILARCIPIALLLLAGGALTLVLTRLEATATYKLLASAGVVAAPTLAGLVAWFRGLTARESILAAVAALTIVLIVASTTEVHYRVDPNGPEERMMQPNWLLEGEKPAEGCTELEEPKRSELLDGYALFHRRFFYCADHQLTIPCPPGATTTLKPKGNPSLCLVSVPAKVSPSIVAAGEGTLVVDELTVLTTTALFRAPLNVRLGVPSEREIRFNLQSQYTARAHVKATSASGNATYALPGVESASILGVEVVGLTPSECAVTAQTRCLSVTELARPNRAHVIIAMRSTETDCGKLERCSGPVGYEDLRGVTVPPWMLDTSIMMDQGLAVEIQKGVMGVLSGTCALPLAWVNWKGKGVSTVMVDEFRWQGSDGDPGFFVCGSPSRAFQDSHSRSGEIKIAPEDGKQVGALVGHKHSGYCYFDNDRCVDANREPTNAIALVGDKSKPGCGPCISFWQRP